MGVDDDVKFHRRHEELTELVYKSPDMLPSRYVFVLTNRCNLKCPFCCQAKIKPSGMMTAAQWISLAGQIPDYARITLTGGEPLLFKGFEEVFRFVSERNPCNVISNGVLLTDKMTELLLSGPNFKVLSVSVDDIGNKSRAMSPDQWGKLVLNLKNFNAAKKAKKHAALLDIKTMILDSNASDLLDIHKFCVEELECGTHVFQFLKGSEIQHSDRMFEFDAVKPPPDDYRYKNWDMILRQLEEVRLYNQRRGFSPPSFLHPKMADISSDERLADLNCLNSPGFDKGLFKPCKFPWSSAHINCDGNLFPCLAVSMGNVREASLRDIVTGEKMRDFRDYIRANGLAGACKRCGWLRPAGESEK
jgi:MoaA/NifB/PqqE/SkfB family radical SAM enzyme